MTRYLVRVYYEGGKYFGYQRQPNVRTVEEELLNALIETKHITSAKQNWFVSASRTDKSVNAIGNVIGFNSDKKIIIEQINAELPSDKSILCWAYVIVEEDFSPKRSYKKKYWYLAEKNVMFENNKEKLKKMQELCWLFEGLNDYKLFCKNDHRDTVREIEKIKVVEYQNYILFEFIARSFLWEQIRRISAYILSYENLPVELKDTKKLLQTQSKIETLNIQPANPNNLILVEQYYENLEWTINNKALELIEEKISNDLRKIKKIKLQKELILKHFTEMRE